MGHHFTTESREDTVSRQPKIAEQCTKSTKVGTIVDASSQKELPLMVLKLII